MKKDEKQKVGSLKLKPLKGPFFDIKPAKYNKKIIFFTSVADYGRFALISFIAFLVLTFGNAYLKGKDIFFESSQLAYAGYAELEEGIGHLLNQEGEKATLAFFEAQRTFQQLQQTTAPFTSQANDLIEKSEHVQTADALIQMALEVSAMGQELAAFADSLKSLPQTFLNEGQKGDIMSLIHEKNEDLNEILKLAISLQNKLVAINEEVLPSDLRPKILTARKQIGDFLEILLQLQKAMVQLRTLLGDEVPHRYLILLQNNHEIRATGGFIGSYLIVDVNDGKITKTETHDVYASDGQLSTVLPPPPGIDKVAKQWFMRDSNYSPDFPTSAKQFMWFLEQGRGPSVDTVIAVDQTFVEEILALIGEVHLDDFPFPINSENFNQVISFYTEAKLSEANSPKQLLFDLIPRFQEKLGSFEDLTRLFVLFQKMRTEGHVQFYSRDEGLETLFKDYGLAGEIIKPQDNLDYLNVVSTSIGGNKTDGFIKTELNHSTQIEGSGEITDELTIKKTHTFNAEDEAVLQNLIDQFGTGKLTEGDLKGILGAGKNLDYMRVYVPLGSRLDEISGVNKKDVKTSEDLGYTVFSFTYGPLSPGETKEVSLTYVLPYELDFWPVGNYRFIAQKQAGLDNIFFHKSLKIPQNLTLQKSYPLPPEGRKMPILSGPFDGIKLFMTAISSE